jgi:hypothetical protein
VSGLLGRLRAALAAHGATMAMTPEDDPSDPPEVWARSNYRGRTVDLRGGPALVAGLLMGAASGRPGGGRSRRPRPVRSGNQPCP